jgi:DNA-binding NarL/FixJ family response regulator
VKAFTDHANGEKREAVSAGVRRNDVLIRRAPVTTVPVLVVDDQASFRAALAELIAATDDFVLVGEAESGEAALEAAEELSPRLVVIDKRMPGLGGIDVSRELTSRHPEMVIVLISVEESLEPAALESSGAAAFVLKRQLSPTVLRKLWEDHGS